MAVLQKDIKLLWGRAASRCAFQDCRIQLTQDKNLATGSFPLGEQAHIVGEKGEGPRGLSPLSATQRDSYSNLILLCPTHHTIIDKSPEDYPVEKLHLIKGQHELWVEQTLSSSQDPDNTAAELIYADFVDAAVQLCRFDNWDGWTGGLMSVYRQCHFDLETGTREFGKKVFRTIWPGSLDELERAIRTLSRVMTGLMDKLGQDFSKNMELKEDILREVKPHIEMWDPELYDKVMGEHDAWGDEVDALVVESTKAANWVADVVRRDMNPMFFATSGRFTITYGPMDDLSMRTVLPVYSDVEKSQMERPKN